MAVMGPRLDEELNALCREVMDGLWELFGQVREAADFGRSFSSGELAEPFVFWNVARIAADNDVFGLMLIKMTGSNDGCNYFFFLEQDKPDRLREYLEIWGLGDDPDRIGRIWKALLRTHNREYYGQATEILGTYRDLLLPKIYPINEDFLGRNYSRHPGLIEGCLKRTASSYRAVRKELKKTIDLFDYADLLQEIEQSDSEMNSQ